MTNRHVIEHRRRMGSFFGAKLKLLPCVSLILATSLPAADTSKNSAGTSHTLSPHEVVSLRLLPAESTLRGNGASQQFVVVGTLAGGQERDLTEQSALELSNPTLARLEVTGRIFAAADGRTELTAVVGGHRATATVTIESSDHERPFHFARDIGVILTRRGCNGSGCHGGVKGRAGFKLSTDASHPRQDYKWIVKGGIYQVLSAESGGAEKPRIDVERPEQSLILRKATMAVPHGGGLRFEKDSADYQAILEWIRKGAPYGEQGETEPPKVTQLDVYPSSVFLKSGEKQRLLVSALLSKGLSEDFTHEVLYSSEQSQVAAVGLDGIVEAKNPGETTILIRAAGHVVSAKVGVIGDAPESYPETPARSFVDEQIFSKLRKFNMVPSSLSSDAEFLRRVCLDLTGTLPPPNRVREFLRDKDPQKREKLIDILLESPEYVDYWTFRFADLFRVALFAIGSNPKWSQDYSEWIRDGIASNRPYDQMARERIAAQGYDGPSRHYLPHAVIGPSHDMMMEQVRVFFGRRFDCAQCHDHPYENWTQDQFWGLTAFFGHVFRTGTSGRDSVVFDHPGGKEIAPDVVGARELRILHPRTGEEVPPTLLDGTVVPHGEQKSVREGLAEWMTAHPYFSEAAVNRIWSHFFGRGIVDPVDDFRATNPPSHPDLLRLLAEDFEDHGYDLKRLVRLIVGSRAYQLSGETNDSNRADGTNYSHALPRALDAEILLDAICDVTGVSEAFATNLPGAKKSGGKAAAGTRAVQLRETDLFYSQFLDLYGRPNRLSVPERNANPSLGQALHLLVGSTYNDKLWSEGARVYDLVQEGASDRQVIEELYLASFSRFPTKHERRDIEKLIAASPSREEALRNLQWAILGYREFAENH